MIGHEASTTQGLSRKPSRLRLFSVTQSLLRKPSRLELQNLLMRPVSRLVSFVSQN